MEAGDLEKPRRVVSRSSSRGSAIGGTGMRTLEKKNKALNNATKELEEKVKNLRERTVHRSLPKVRIRTPEKTLPEIITLIRLNIGYSTLSDSVKISYWV